MAIKRNTAKQEKVRIPPIKIMNAKLIYKNFGGEQKRFNKRGDRNFHVVLDEALANQLKADGWNVRWHDAKEEGDPQWASLKVAVRYDNYPPIINMKTASGLSTMTEPMLGVLDWAELDSVNLRITASQWTDEAKGTSGVKAYLSRMTVTIDASDLAFEGIDVDKISQSPSDDNAI